MVFKGIPYAQPPVGDLRFSPPLAPEPFSGMKDASQFGFLAPQSSAAQVMILPGDPGESNEDCLTLNIWAPLHASQSEPLQSSQTVAPGGEKLPVMVWIHGGGFVGGSAVSSIYDGQYLASRCGVVVVTINYRLGVFGFLAHPDLRVGSDSGGGFSGNWGLLDQLAALSWVHDNIEFFGGDADNVTLFGESAGAMCIASLLGANVGRGLFKRVILQSGPPMSTSLASAAQYAELFCKQLGLKKVDRSGLCSVSTEEILEAQHTVLMATGGDLTLPFRPVIDGELLEHPTLDALSRGHAGDVEVMAGTNLDETNFFTLSDSRFSDLNEDKLERFVAKALDSMKAKHKSGSDVQPAELIDAYRQIIADEQGHCSVVDLWCAMTTDWTFHIPTSKFLEIQSAWQKNCYSYLFTYPSPLMDGVLGSCHALEVPLVFGTFSHPFLSLFTGTGEEVRRLSELLQDTWSAFARNGNPSNDALGEWYAYDRDKKTTMVFGSSCYIEQDPLEHRHTIWRDIDFLLPDQVKLELKTV